MWKQIIFSLWSSILVQQALSTLLHRGNYELQSLLLVSYELCNYFNAYQIFIVNLDSTFEVLSLWILQDLELAKTLVRPGSFFIGDLSQQKNFSKQRYGSVPRAFIVCTEDLAIPLEFQLWLIQNAGIKDVFEIKGAQHMAMLNKRQEVYDSLQQIATKYA